MLLAVGGGRFAGCFVALALLFAVAIALLLAVVTTGDAYLLSPPRRVQWWSSLAELLLPASSLTRNTRNSLVVPIIPSMKASSLSLPNAPRSALIDVETAVGPPAPELDLR